MDNANTPLPCPFCGSIPDVRPSDPKNNGNAWGEVRCVNGRCPAKPRVDDGARIADDRGSDKYKRLAIKRWNKRDRLTAAAPKLLDALLHVMWCQDCAEGSWRDCEGGRLALEAMNEATGKPRTEDEPN